jgi:hypothetical protein
MVAKIALCAALVLAAPIAAHAMCRDDIHDIKPRIDHEKIVDLQRYYLALKWFGKAQDAEPASEVDCLNDLARARKALREPIPGAGGGGSEEPVMAIGGNGAPQSVLPVGPVTETPPPAYVAPGSVPRP